MSGLLGEDTQDITEGGDQSSSSENDAGSDNHEDSDATQPIHYDIVPQQSDGDLIWECKDKVSFLVSSAILRVSSDYFRALLDGKFKEGQVPRSATNPQRIETEEKDSYVMHRLLCFLHHQRDPDQTQHLIHFSEIKGFRDEKSIEAAARRVQDLATVIDYYGCHEPLDCVTEKLLTDLWRPSRLTTPKVSVFA